MPRFIKLHLATYKGASYQVRKEIALNVEQITSISPDDNHKVGTTVGLASGFGVHIFEEYAEVLALLINTTKGE